MQTVHAEQDYDVPVGSVFAYFAEHENLEAVFPAKIQRLRDGDTERNGVGSVRRLKMGGLLPLEETVTAYAENQRIEYRITKGSPMRDHLGTMIFSSNPDGGTHLDYTITFRAAVPGLAPLLAVILQRGLAGGLRKAKVAA